MINRATNITLSWGEVELLVRYSSRSLLSGFKEKELKFCPFCFLFLHSFSNTLLFFFPYLSFRHALRFTSRLQCHFLASLPLRTGTPQLGLMLDDWLELELEYQKRWGLGNSRPRRANIEIGSCLSHVKSKGNLVSVNWPTKNVGFPTQLKNSHSSVFAISLHYHEFSLKIFPRCILASFPQLSASSPCSTSESTTVVTILFVYRQNLPKFIVPRYSLCTHSSEK